MKSPGIYITPVRTTRLPANDAATKPTIHLVARATPEPVLDHGLWLLRGAAARNEGWRRLHARVDRTHAAGRTFRIAKRCIDLIGSIILLVLLFPVFLIIAVLVKSDSPGPIFFRQQRVGINGRRFLLWKFRSMQVDAPQYAPSPIVGTDPRMTHVGRLIRRISVDEIPQLLNVLKGEMSLVGPRPEMPFVVARYTEEQRRRLVIKPGITGLWQISSGRAHPIHENLHYDLHYIQHRNPLLDAAILLRTLIVVLRGHGAV